MTDVRELSNEELAEELKRVVWHGGWDAVLKEIERRLKKLTRMEKDELLRTQGQ